MKFIEQGIPFTQAMKDYAEQKLSKIIPYLSKEAYDSIEIRLSYEGDNMKVEVSINYENIHLRVSEVNFDYYSSIDILEDQLIRKIRKYKTAIQNKQKNAVHKFLSTYEDPEEYEDDEDENLNISKEKFIVIDEESAEDAIISMNELEHDFYVYRDIDSGDVSIIYRRHNGSYGKITVK